MFFQEITASADSQSFHQSLLYTTVHSFIFIRISFIRISRPKFAKF